MARVLILVLAFMLAAGARADTLSEAEVERFMAAMEKLQASEPFLEALLAAWQDNLRTLDQPASLMVSDAVAFLHGEEAYRTLDRVVRDHGFGGADAWGRVGDRILLAVMSLEMGDLAPRMRTEMARIERELQDNAAFSDAQKTRMRQMVRAGAQLVERVEQVRGEDQQAVRPYLAALKQALAYRL